MVAETRERKLLGLDSFIYSRTSVYLAGDCIEAETRDIAEIQRNRIYLDDVAMVTASRRVNPSYIAQMLIVSACLIVALGLSIIGAVAGRGDQIMAILATSLGVGSAILVGQLLIHLAVKEDVITVYGRRRKIEMRFGLFKRQRFDDAYSLVLNSVRDAMAQTNARLERERPPEPVVEMFARPPADLGSTVQGFEGSKVEQVPEEAPPMPPLGEVVPLDATDSQGGRSAAPPTNVAPAEPPPFAERAATVSEDGLHVEYNPEAAPRKPPPARPAAEPDLPFIPEIKIRPPEEK